MSGWFENKNIRKDGTMPNKKCKHQPAGVGMTPSKTELGSFIRARRLKLELRQVSLDKILGLNRSLTSALETGSRMYLSDHQIDKLAEVLQCSPEDLRERMPVKPGSEARTELGKLIHSRREELGLTPENFAKKMGMTRQQTKELEVRRNPNTNNYGLIRLLASALDFEPSVFVRFVNTNSRPSDNELGQLIRRRRMDLAMSIIELAKRLRVSRQFVSYIELGKIGLSESDKTIERLARVLGLSRRRLKAVRPKPRKHGRKPHQHLAL